MSDYIPEILRVIRDQIMKYKNPLAIKMSSCTDTCSGDICRENCETIMYTGCLYTTMGIVEKIGFMLSKVTKNPASDLSIKLFKKFMGPGGKLAAKFRNKEFDIIPRKAMEILKRIGVNAVCLDEEPYNGALLYDLGFHEELIKYGEYLRDFFKSKGVKKIILIDPHSYDVFMNFYKKEIKDFDFEILNIIDLINKAIDEGKIKLKSDELKTVTYHDPCNYSKSTERRIIEEPRRIIRSIEGLDLREPEYTKNFSECCGGPLEFIFHELSSEIAEMRVNELLATGAEKIITACPICSINFRRVLKKEKNKVMDIIDLVYESMER